MTKELHHLWVRNGAILMVELALLAVSVWIAFIPMNGYNTAVNIFIAGVMATIGLLFFMDLRNGSAIIRLTAATGFVWLSLMFALTLFDYLTRFSTTVAGPS